MSIIIVLKEYLLAYTLYLFVPSKGPLILFRKNILLKHNHRNVMSNQGKSQLWSNFANLEEVNNN